MASLSDPELRITARLHIRWALVWSNRHAEALATLIAVAEETSARLPVIAWDAIGTAAIVAYQSGIPAGPEAVLDTLSYMEEPAPQPPDWPLDTAPRSSSRARSTVQRHYPADSRRIALMYRRAARRCASRPKGPEILARSVPGRVKARTVNQTSPASPMLTMNASSPDSG